MTVRLKYSPPMGAAGNLIAKLFGEHPQQQVGDDLRRFKQVMETGEVIRSEGTPAGTKTINLIKQRPAVPVS